MRYLPIAMVVMVAACSGEDRSDSGGASLEGGGPEASVGDAAPDATGDGALPDATAPDATTPDATTPDASVPKPTCNGVWQTSLVAPSGLSKIALTAAGKPYVMTGSAVWTQSGGSWTTHPIPTGAGDIAIVPETGEIHLCGTECSGPPPTPPFDWVGTPPNPFCRGVHVAGTPGNWSVSQLPALPDNGYSSCGSAPYYFVKWLGSPCSIDARADGSVEIVQRVAHTAPFLEVCGIDFYRHSKKAGTWSQQGVGVQNAYFAANDRVNIRMDSAGAAHWNTCWYGYAKYDTSQATWQPWSQQLVGAARLALDAQGAPTFAGAGWSVAGPGDKDAIYFLAPIPTGGWLPQEVAMTSRPPKMVDYASDSKPGLAYMQNGEPIVCWTDKGLHCASRANGAWTEKLLSADADDTSEAEVRVAANGCCHIAYRAASGAVHHATDCQ